jgi:hypothetical protein
LRLLKDAEDKVAPCDVVKLVVIYCAHADDQKVIGASSYARIVNGIARS